MSVIMISVSMSSARRNDRSGNRIAIVSLGPPRQEKIKRFSFIFEVLGFLIDGDT